MANKTKKIKTKTANEQESTIMRNLRKYIWKFKLWNFWIMEIHIKHEITGMLQFSSKRSYCLTEMWKTYVPVLTARGALGPCPLPR